ncbi:helix-turn-helix domain-containing protein [Bacillus dakarensis]|uniref:helix-turn-helix domain-containing protein n=1 Tax=Robertmurraya dakarensis TaxID=1926278 RepID=UPI0009810CF6|nr:helix-turn-helix domain-containing protein [Bacillus dakarensis]
MTELGNRLKEARLAKGMSLDDLQTVTKIQKRYLTGIEEGNYSMMPGPFYVRAFIKQYAEAVDVEPEELFDQYKSEIPDPYKDDIPEKLSRVQSRKNISNNSGKVFDVLPKVLVAAFVIGGLFLIWYFWSLNANDEPEEHIAENKNQETTYEQSENLSKGNNDVEEQTDEEESLTEDPEETEEIEEPETPEMKQEVAVIETEGKETLYELKNTDQFQLKLVSTGETWVSIKNGKGYSFFQGMLVKGGTESQSVDLSKETEAVLIIGNSTNTEIYVNDQMLDYAVPPTDHVRQDITIRFTPADQ